MKEIGRSTRTWKSTWRRRRTAKRYSFDYPLIQNLVIWLHIIQLYLHY